MNTVKAYKHENGLIQNVAIFEEGLVPSPWILVPDGVLVSPGGAVNPNGSIPVVPPRVTPPIPTSTERVAARREADPILALILKELSKSNPAFDNLLNKVFD